MRNVDVGGPRTQWVGGSRADYAIAEGDRDARLIGLESLASQGNPRTGEAGGLVHIYNGCYVESRIGPLTAGARGNYVERSARGGRNCQVSGPNALGRGIDGFRGQIVTHCYGNALSGTGTGAGKAHDGAWRPTGWLYPYTSP